MSEIDRQGIISFLKPDCIDCNMHLRKLEKTRCSDCKLIFNSTYWNNNKTYRRTRVGCSREFSKYGIDNPPELGKCQLFYFLYHPELNFKLPPVPMVDLNKNTWLDKKFIWHLHHINGEYWNDNIWNLLLCLSTEHKSIENAEQKYIKEMKDKSFKLIWG